MTEPSKEKPSGRNEVHRPGLAATAERGVARDLDAMIAEEWMSRSDAGNAIARDLDAAAGLALPGLDDIERLSESPRLQPDQQFETMLLLSGTGDLASAEKGLNELLDRGAATIEERNILRRGQLFLRNRLYNEAAEWWRLNTPADSAAPFALVMQVLLALTYRQQGDETRAVALLSKLKPEIDRLTGRKA